MKYNILEDYQKLLEEINLIEKEYYILKNNKEKFTELEYASKLELYKTLYTDNVEDILKLKKKIKLIDRIKIRCKIWLQRQLKTNKNLKKQ